MIVILFLYLLAGTAGGFLSGLLGIGGGLVIVPILALVFHIEGLNQEVLMHVAIGSSLGSMIATSSISALSHIKNGAKVLPTFPMMIVGLLLGILIGSLTADGLNSKYLAMFFGGFMILIGLHFAFPIHFVSTQKDPSCTSLTAASLFIGTLSSILGIGGGIMTVPFLTYRNTPIHDAIAISACNSLVIAVVGSLAYLATGWDKTLPPHCLGYLNFPAILAISATSPFFTYMGAKTARKLDVKALKKVFAVLLFIVGTRMLFF